MTNQTPSNSVVTEARQAIARIVGAIDDDLERQADIQTGCDYWRTDECGVAAANMNIVTSELASAIYLAMQSATGSDELVSERKLIDRTCNCHPDDTEHHPLCWFGSRGNAIATPDTDRVAVLERELGCAKASLESAQILLEAATGRRSIAIDTNIGHIEAALSQALGSQGWEK